MLYARAILCDGPLLQNIEMDRKLTATDITATRTSLEMHYMNEMPADCVYVMHCNYYVK